MDITAKGKLDEQSVIALGQFGVFKKIKPNKGVLLLAVIGMFPTIYTCIRLLILTRVEKSNDPIELIMAVVPLIIIDFVLSIPIMIPVIKVKTLGKMQNAAYEYHFYDSSFNAICRRISGSTTTNIKYSELTMVGESSKHFFIYQGRKSFIVDKSTIENGTAEHLRHRFSSLENIKYITCQY